MSSVVEIEDAEVKKLIKGLIKNVGEISEKSARYVGLLSSIVLGDIIDHFENEAGPSGRWAPWSTKYQKYMLAVGKGGNLILSDTGRLRQGWQPTRYKIERDGVLWYNPVKYAAVHNEGIAPYPQRKFTWLSKKAVNEIERQTAKFAETIK